MLQPNEFEVYMLAFGKPGEMRTVTIPEDELREINLYESLNILDLIFKWGQNDFQPQRHPSVSVGDVIALKDGGLYLVLPMGFAGIGKGVLKEYQETPREDRWKLVDEIKGYKQYRTKY